MEKQKTTVELRWSLVGLLFAVAYWVGETLIHVNLFHTGGFWEELFPIDDPNELWMRSLIALLFLILGFGADRMIAKLKKSQQEKERLIAELQESLREIKTLSGLLPICTVCKKVKDDAGYWHQVETYIHDHSDVDLSHGYCPECAKEILQGIDEANDAKLNGYD